MANVIWQKKYAKQNDATWFSTSHDHIVVYARDKGVWRPNSLERKLSQLKGYLNPDNDPRGDWQSVVYTCNKTKAERPNLFYPIRRPKTGEEIYPSETRVWGYEEATHLQHEADNRLWWGRNGELAKPRLKVFLKEVGTGVVPDTIWLRADVGDNQDAKRILMELLPEVSFETPKPPRLIRQMLSVATSADERDVVLDFFAGSGSTAQAVIEHNAEDGGNRRFILVQLPEPTDNAAMRTIAEITKERVRRVAKKLNEEENKKLDLDGNQKRDRGFRVFKLAESNFQGWETEKSADANALGEQLRMHIDHLVHGRTDEDILSELLLKAGFPLTVPVEKMTLAGKTVFSIGGGVFLVCLDRALNLEVIRAIAELKPSRVLCLDAGFGGDDQLKVNAVQTFKTKGIAKFQTV